MQSNPRTTAAMVAELLLLDFTVSLLVSAMGVRGTAVLDGPSGPVGAPQCMQRLALSDTSLSHSMHLNSAMGDASPVFFAVVVTKWHLSPRLRSNRRPTVRSSESYACRSFHAIILVPRVPTSCGSFLLQRVGKAQIDQVAAVSNCAETCSGHKVAPVTAERRWAAVSAGASLAA